MHSQRFPVILGAGADSTWCESEFRTCGAPDARAGSASAPRILVVEDDRIQALVLMTFLERMGESAMLVDSGHRAIEAVHDHRFELVLMDYLMPSMSGAEAASLIRTWEKSNGLQSVPIVAVTACAMEAEQQRYFAAGMNAVLLKPFTAGQLRAMLERYLAPISTPPSSPWP